MSTAKQDPVKMRSGHQRNRIQLARSRSNATPGVGKEIGMAQTIEALKSRQWRSTLDVICAGGRMPALERLVEAGHVKVRGVIYREEWRLVRLPK